VGDHSGYHTVSPTQLTVLSALQWVLLAGLIESGRRILNRWFILALQREQENADLIHQLGLLASKDPLTGLANRRSFEERMDQEIASHQQDGKGFGLIMLDVDHFKLYNDHYGHQQGDRCLIMIAGVLESASRENEGIVGRVGGEEFMVLLPRPMSARCDQLRNAFPACWKARHSLTPSPQSILT
jgi:GGDEF domain-containing protein